MSDKKKEFELELVEHFSDEMALLDEALEQVTAFYQETKIHFDNIKGAKERGMLTFISNQTGNINTLQGTRISIIKEKMAIKKQMADLSFKVKGGEGDSEATQKILDAINNKLSDADFKDDMDDDLDYDDTDDDSMLEEQLEQDIKDGLIDYNENDQIAEFELIDVSFSVLLFTNKKGKNAWKFIAIDVETGERVKDYPTELMPDKKKTELTYRSDGKNKIAVDQYQKIYSVVNKRKKKKKS